MEKSPKREKDALWYLKYLVAFVIGALITLLCAWLRGLFKGDGASDVRFILSDSFLVSGVLLAGVGGLMFSSARGTFDMFSYGVKMFFVPFRRNMRPEDRFARDFFEYREEKRQKSARREYLYLILVGAFYLLLSALCLLI